MLPDAGESDEAVGRRAFPAEEGDAPTAIHAAVDPPLVSDEPTVALAWDDPTWFRPANADHTPLPDAQLVDDSATVVTPERGIAQPGPIDVADDYDDSLVEEQPLEAPWTRLQAILGAGALVLLVVGSGLIFTGFAALISVGPAPITVGELITVAGWCVLALAAAIWHKATHRLITEFRPRTVAIFAGVVVALVVAGLPFHTVVAYVPMAFAFAAGTACLVISIAIAALVNMITRRARSSAAPLPAPPHGDVNGF